MRGRPRTRLDICAHHYCNRQAVHDGLCRGHQPPVTLDCGHEAEISTLCAVCGLRCCDACYGPWNALACEGCRRLARTRHATV